MTTDVDDDSVNVSALFQHDSHFYVKPFHQRSARDRPVHQRRQPACFSYGGALVSVSFIFRYDVLEMTGPYSAPPPENFGVFYLEITYASAFLGIMHNSRV